MECFQQKNFFRNDNMRRMLKTYTVSMLIESLYRLLKVVVSKFFDDMKEQKV